MRRRGEAFGRAEAARSARHPQGEARGSVGRGMLDAEAGDVWGPQKRDEMNEPEAQPKTVVLNVNDSDAMRFAISAMLKRADFEILEAVTGEEALSMIDSHEPHLVLLDVHLPDANGFEVCRRVRKNPFHGTTRIVHTSAMSVSLEDKIESLESGADGFLEQPFELDALISCVRSLLDQGQAAQPVASVRASERAHEPAFAAPPADHLLETLEAIDDGVICLDASWRFTFVNAMAERVLGRKRSELLGQVIWAAMPALEASHVGNGYRRAMAERTAATLTGLPPAFNAFMHARALPTPHGLLVLFQPRAEQQAETTFVGKKTLRGV